MALPAPASASDPDLPDRRSISNLPTTAKNFSEVVEALRSGTARHVYGPVPRHQMPFAASGLRLAGLSFVEIAEVLDTTPEQARQLTAEGLATLARDDDTARDERRMLANARLDTLLSSIWGDATNQTSPTQLASVNQASKLIEQHTKLWGLNAPVEHTIHTPDAAKIAELVRQVAMPVVDADVFDYDEDAEIVEDDDPDGVI